MRIAFSIVIGMMAFAVPAQSQAQSAPIEGSWGGSGFFKPTSGDRESVKCRVRYSRITETIFSLSGMCASASGTVQQSGEVLKVGANSYVGDFKNINLDVAGRIRVKVRGSLQTVTLTSDSGSGSITLNRR